MLTIQAISCSLTDECSLTYQISYDNLLVTLDPSCFIHKYYNTVRYFNNIHNYYFYACNYV